MIEILTGSGLNTIQDLGRTGMMNLGISHGGAMDRQALAHGNILLGNVPDAAGIEIAFFPFRLRFHASTSFALTGARTDARLDGIALPADWAMTARARQTLVIGTPECGARAYICFGGGLDVPVMFGSRSTDLKGGFGGFQGRALQRGDRLECLPTDAATTLPPYGLGLAQHTALPLREESLQVRVLPAAEYAAFTAGAQHCFITQDWTVSARANRAGYQFDGTAPLALSRPLNLFSHGIVPGTVQVPPTGMPIVQMADANTCGGYPKIATVIAPDLRLLAQAGVGATVRFVIITHAEAIIALREDARMLAGLVRDISALRSTLAAGPYPVSRKPS